MTNNDMNVEDEEKFLIDKLLSARHVLKLHKEETGARRLRQNQLEKELADIEQACVDYMTANGLRETSALSISETYSVDVPDVGALPDEFVRVKIIREPNKVLIRELRPDANWYAIKKGYKLTYNGE